MKDLGLEFDMYLGNNSQTPEMIRKITHRKHANKIEYGRLIENRWQLHFKYIINSITCFIVKSLKGESKTQINKKENIKQNKLD